MPKARPTWTARRSKPMRPSTARTPTGIKSVMRFRQFGLRGLQKVQGECKLVAMSWNMKRLFALSG